MECRLHVGQFQTLAMTIPTHSGHGQSLKLRPVELYQESRSDWRIPVSRQRGIQCGGLDPCKHLHVHASAAMMMTMMMMMMMMPTVPHVPWIVAMQAPAAAPWQVEQHAEHLEDQFGAHPCATCEMHGQTATRRNCTSLGIHSLLGR